MFPTNYDKRLGWKGHIRDERDDKWKMQFFLTAKDYELAQTITKKEWDIKYLLGQGDTPHCVGFAWAHHAIAEDIDLGTWPVSESRAHEIYYKACEIGGYPNTEEGSTTRDGAEASRFFQYVKNYTWTNERDPFVVWLLTKGSIVTGIPWYSEMFSPDSTGLVRARGYIAGGHEICASGIDKETGLIKIANSWNEPGAVWGPIGGYCYVTFDDYFGKLLYPLGDAAAAVDYAPNPPEPPPPEPPPPEPEPGGCGKRLYFFRRAITG